MTDWENIYSRKKKTHKRYLEYQNFMEEVLKCVYGKEVFPMDFF